ncbi:hypothetical protein LEJE111609_20270 [Lelliottia jeotgali]
MPYCRLPDRTTIRVASWGAPHQQQEMNEVYETTIPLGIALPSI